MVLTLNEGTAVLATSSGSPSILWISAMSPQRWARLRLGSSANWFNTIMTKHGEFGHLAGYNQYEYSSHEVGMALWDLLLTCLWACMSCFWDE